MRTRAVSSSPRAHSILLTCRCTSSVREARRPLRDNNHGQTASHLCQEFWVPPHRGTSEVLAGAYPFLAEGGLGSDGTFIGQDAWSGGGFCFDPWALYQNGTITNPNCLLAGVVGRGKSMLAKAMATRSLDTGHKVYVP